MEAFEALARLNREAKDWQLKVSRNGKRIEYYVAGSVLPKGKLRGVRPFFGMPSPDAHWALIYGAQELHYQQERISK